MRAATATAPSRPVSGRIRANSSPPNRATTSVSRAQPRITRAGLDQRLAARQVAVAVVDLLEAVQIQEQQRQRPAVARGALGLTPQRLVEVARVVQPGQVVGDRQSLRLLQRERVIERNRRRLEDGAQRRGPATAPAPALAPRRWDRGRPARRRSVPADQGQGDRRSRPPRLSPRESFARSRDSNSTPWRNTQFADAQSAGPRSASARVGNDIQLSVACRGRPRPSTARGSSSGPGGPATRRPSRDPAFRWTRERLRRAASR